MKSWGFVALVVISSVVVSVALTCPTGQAAAVPSLAGDTFFVPALVGYDGARDVARATVGNAYSGILLQDGKTVTAFGEFVVPEGCGIVTAEALVRMGGMRGSIRAVAIADYGAIDETPARHSDHSGYSILDIRPDRNNGILPLALTRAEAGDVVMLRFIRDGNYNPTGMTMVMTGWIVRCDNGSKMIRPPRFEAD